MYTYNFFLLLLVFFTIYYEYFKQVDLNKKKNFHILYEYEYSIFNIFREIIILLNSFTIS